jgi:hypothetical protein
VSDVNPEEIANAVADYVSEHLADDGTDGATEDPRGGWFFEFDNGWSTYTVHISDRYRKGRGEKESRPLTSPEDAQ